ncbi:MAG: dephospho-CoA kinase [Rhodobacteraceae bacterium]|nr:dephospho-CoA kinase [Paracoccaceae bacterium]
MKKKFVLGLTGSIGMGKSTTAKMFEEAGIPVWDADAKVHELYTGDTPVVQQIANMFPDAVENKTVNRETLKDLISKDKSVLKILEKIVQPVIAVSRNNFIASANNDIVVIDHPLLLESRSDSYCDAILVVNVDAETQRNRVLSRGSMDAGTLDVIIDKQIPNAEKCKRADYIIETKTLKAARAQVQNVIKKIREQILCEKL